MKKPLVIRRDSLAVKIYECDSHGAQQYTLVFRQDGKRKYISSRDLAALEARAEEILDDLSAARPVTNAGAFNAHEREEFEWVANGFA
jgi:hypothetical protein